MAKVSDIYGGTYLTGVDLAGKSYRLPVEAVTVEEIGDEREEKLVVSFRGAKKSLVLNKTNASALVAAYGDDTDAWPGRMVELFTVPVTFNGRTYDGVRIRAVELPAPKPEGVPASQTRRALEHSHANGLDDAPF